MKTWIKVFVIITYIGMIVVNALANIIPINGITTGEVSNLYENLFAPSSITFSIWGVIYFLLAIFTLYQAGLFRNNDKHAKLLNNIGILFSISSVANMLWIFAWHYQILSLSVILMTIILISLILIVTKIKNTNLNSKEKFFISIPFSIYFGWITVATIANITAFLVKINWDGFGLSEVFWAITIIIIGAIIGILTIIKNKDSAYGAVIIWAYIGILIKHLSANGFDRMYPSVIITVIISIIIVSIINIFVFFKSINH